MKNVAVAVILLSLAVGFTVCNALWVDARLHAILELAAEDRTEEALQEFLQAEAYLALTVHEAALKNAEIALREMPALQETHPEEYAAAKERFIAYIEEIRSKEKFAFSNLF